MKYLMPIALLSLLLGACSSTKVGHDYDTAFDFSQAKTYAWLDSGETETGTPALLDSGLREERIRHSADALLGSQGYRLVAASEADMHLRYFQRTEKKALVQDSGPGVSIGGGSSSRGGSFGGIGLSFNLGEKSDTDEILILSIINPTTGKLIWRSTAVQPLKTESDPAKSQARIQKTVEKMLQGFPPKAGR